MFRCFHQFQPFFQCGVSCLIMVDILRTFEGIEIMGVRYALIFFCFCSHLSEKIEVNGIKSLVTLSAKNVISKRFRDAKIQNFQGAAPLNPAWGGLQRSQNPQLKIPCYARTLRFTQHYKTLFNLFLHQNILFLPFFYNKKVLFCPFFVRKLPFFSGRMTQN